MKTFMHGVFTVMEFAAVKNLRLPVVGIHAAEMDRPA